jgi:hypothetical protein
LRPPVIGGVRKRFGYRDELTVSVDVLARHADVRLAIVVDNLDIHKWTKLLSVLSY